jgi:hypothetical protein
MIMKVGFYEGLDPQKTTTIAHLSMVNGMLVGLEQDLRRDLKNLRAQVQELEARNSLVTKEANRCHATFASRVDDMDNKILQISIEHRQMMTRTEHMEQDMKVFESRIERLRGFVISNENGDPVWRSPASNGLVTGESDLGRGENMALAIGNATRRRGSQRRGANSNRSSSQESLAAQRIALNARGASAHQMRLRYQRGEGRVGDNPMMNNVAPQIRVPLDLPIHIRTQGEIEDNNSRRREDEERRTRGEDAAYLTNDEEEEEDQRRGVQGQDEQREDEPMLYEQEGHQNEANGDTPIFVGMIQAGENQHLNLEKFSGMNEVPFTHYIQKFNDFCQAFARPLGLEEKIRKLKYYLTDYARERFDELTDAELASWEGVEKRLIEILEDPQLRSVAKARLSAIKQKASEPVLMFSQRLKTAVKAAYVGQPASTYQTQLLDSFLEKMLRKIAFYVKTTNPATFTAALNSAMHYESLVAAEQDIDEVTPLPYQVNSNAVAETQMELKEMLANLAMNVTRAIERPLIEAKMNAREQKLWNDTPPGGITFDHGDGRGRATAYVKSPSRDPSPSPSYDNRSTNRGDNRAQNYRQNGQNNYDNRYQNGGQQNRDNQRGGGYDNRRQNDYGGGGRQNNQQNYNNIPNSGIRSYCEHHGFGGHHTNQCRLKQCEIHGMGTHSSDQCNTLRQQREERGQRRAPAGPPPAAYRNSNNQSSSNYSQNSNSYGRGNQGATNWIQAGKRSEEEEKIEEKVVDQQIEVVQGEITESPKEDIAEQLRKSLECNEALKEHNQKLASLAFPPFRSNQVMAVPSFKQVKLIDLLG